jgi:LacI family transcriptional regulator
VALMTDHDKGPSGEPQPTPSEPVSIPTPFRSGKRPLSRNISLIVPGLHVADYVGLVVQGVFKSSHSLEYNIILHVQNSALQTHNASHFRSLITNNLTDGFLLIVPHFFDVFTQLCREYQVPCVAIDDAAILQEDIPMISATDQQGIVDAMHHLASLGHRRIGFITGFMHVYSSRKRLQGYRDALEELGIPYDPALVKEGDWERRTGFRLTQQLLALEEVPTAILASNDIMAFGAMEAIKEAALSVGSDISVMGFDDIPEAATSVPPLSTTRQPMERMGQAAIELLIDLIEGHPPTTERQFKTELIVRQSTGPLKP